MKKQTPLNAIHSYVSGYSADSSNLSKCKPNYKAPRMHDYSSYALLQPFAYNQFQNHHQLFSIFPQCQFLIPRSTGNQLFVDECQCWHILGMQHKWAGHQRVFVVSSVVPQSYWAVSPRGKHLFLLLMKTDNPTGVEVSTELCYLFEGFTLSVKLVPRDFSISHPTEHSANCSLKVCCTWLTLRLLILKHAISSHYIVVMSI